MTRARESSAIGSKQLSASKQRDDAALLSDNSGDEFLSSLVASLPDREREILNTLERVKDVYVECGRDRLLAQKLDAFVLNMLANRNGRRDDGRAYFITGASGAGKTSAVRHMLANSPVLQPQSTSYGLIKPVISVTLSGPCTLKILGRMILTEAGYPLRQKLDQGELWEMLPKILHNKKVLIIHVDETQHMLRQTETDFERKNVAKALKGVMNYEPWPISFIMTGMPETTELCRMDEQIERRASFVELPDVALPAERKLVERIISRLCSAGALGAQQVIESDLPERIAHAARYRYGRITQITIAAIQTALRMESSALTAEHFARVYQDHSHAHGYDEMNPFLVNNWRQLDPGSFLINNRLAN